MAGFEVPVLGLELGSGLGYMLCLVAIWAIIGRVYPLISIVRSWLPRGSLGKRYGQGSWAVVTGASRGLGRGFCQALAQAGFNIVLISRGNTQALATNLEATYKVQTRTLQKDFAGKGADLRTFYEGISADLEDLDVSILVNSVGVAYDGLFAKEPMQELVDTVEINVLPMVFLTRWALNRMQKRPKRSAIINISSLSGLIPYAGFAIYCASKRFNDAFSIALAHETDISPDLPVDILSLRPSYVHTDMIAGLKVQAEPANTVSVEACVEGTLNALGRGKYTAGTFRHTWVIAAALRHREEEESKGYLAALPERV